MALITNCAEGGTDGVAVTTANSGGLSGTAVSSINAPANFATIAAGHGSLGYEMVWSASTSGQMIWNLSTAGRAVLRFYFRLKDTVPTAQEYLATIRSTTGNMGHVTINSVAKISIQNAGGAGRRTMVDALAADTWYRAELAITKGTTTSDGRIEFAYYLGDSATAIETWDSSVENTGTANVASVRIGRNTSSTLARTNQYDSIAAEDLASGWLGPAYVAAPGGIAGAEAFGTATVTVQSSGVTVSPTGIASAEVLGTLAVSTTLTTSPTGIASDEAGGSPTLSTVLTATPGGIASDEAFGAPTIVTSGIISPSGIPSGEAAGTPELTTFLTASPSGIPSGQTFGAPIVSGSLTLSPSGITTQEGIGTPTVILDAQNQTISPVGIASGEAVGTPALTKPSRTVSPAGIPSLESVNPAKLSTILVFWPTTIPSGQAFGTPALTYVANASIPGIPSAEAFGTPAIHKGLVVSAQGIASLQAIGNVRLTGPGLSKLEYELSAELANGRTRGTIGDPSTTTQTPARWEGSLG